MPFVNTPRSASFSYGSAIESNLRLSGVMIVLPADSSTLPGLFMVNFHNGRKLLFRRVF